MNATTPRMQEILREGWEAARKIGVITGRKIYGFPDNRMSRMDAVVVRDDTGQVTSMMEIKNRDITEERFKDYNMELRVGLDKLMASYQMASVNQVGHYYMAFLRGSNVAYLQQVFYRDDSEGYKKPIPAAPIRITVERSDVECGSSRKWDEPFAYIGFGSARRFDLKNF